MQQDQEPTDEGDSCNQTSKKIDEINVELRQLIRYILDCSLNTPLFVGAGNGIGPLAPDD